MTCIATFFSHFGAIRFKKICEEQRWPAQLMPVPRDLSSSCGTCVRYEGSCPSQLSDEEERVVAVTEQGYRALYQAEDC